MMKLKIEVFLVSLSCNLCYFSKCLKKCYWLAVMERNAILVKVEEVFSINSVINFVLIKCTPLFNISNLTTLLWFWNVWAFLSTHSNIKKKKVWRHQDWNFKSGKSLMLIVLYTNVYSAFGHQSVNLQWLRICLRF